MGNETAIIYTTSKRYNTPELKKINLAMIATICIKCLAFKKYLILNL